MATEAQRHSGYLLPQEPEVYYPWFDFLRIALALGVFCAHADVPMPEMFGNACVQVFFALSGFLIGGILCRTERAQLPRFYFNRVTRIWIPYAIAILLLLAMTLVKRQKVDLKMTEFFVYMATFVYNYFGPPQLATARERMPLEGTGNHFWSICVEEQFYLIAPFIVVLLPRVRVALLLLVWALNFWKPHDFAGIALGVLLALSLRHYGEWYLKRAAVAVLALISGGLVVASLKHWVPYPAAAPLASVALVALLARRGSPLPFGKLLGGISYPFYLNHGVGLLLRKSMARLLGMPVWGTFIAALAISYSFNWAHYWFVDRTVHAKRGGWYTPARGRACFIGGVVITALGLAAAWAFHRWPPP
jgi:peptidoglycan/LPS O-acetylase OafA/YrhL